MGARQGLPTYRRGLGRGGGLLGCRSARGPRVPVWCGSGRDAQPSELGRMRQARDSHFSGVGWVWGYARGSVSPPAGTVPELEGCLGLWIWQDASGLEPLGTPAPFSSHPTPLRNGLGLGVRPRVAEAAGGMLGLLDLAGRHQSPFDPASTLPPPGVDWVWGAVLGSRAGPKRKLEGRSGLKTPRCAVHRLPCGCPRIAAVRTRP